MWTSALLAYIALIVLIVLALFNKRIAGWKLFPVLISWLFVIGVLLDFTGFLIWHTIR
jgi:hypothetical protein